MSSSQALPSRSLISQVLPTEAVSVFITDELGRRHGSSSDHQQLNVALKDLARQMVGDPAHVLPRLVDFAMNICAAVSGGISLYEPLPPPGFFRWHHLRGELEKFVGATTPRNFSPCGVTLDLASPTLVQRPERVYTWLQDANVSLPECLLVPLYVGEKEPLGTLWIVSKDEGHFNANHSEAMNELAAFAGIALKMAMDQQRLRNALDEQETLAREMGHRVKNVFSIADALIRIGARRGGTAEELADRISGRLHALSTAHGLVNAVFDGGERRAGSEFDYVLRTILSPYDRNNFVIEGSPLCVGPRATNLIALALHELATNAAKYGSLCSDDGRISVKWTTDDGLFRLNWQEIDGPPVTAVPSKKGFGAFLAEKSIHSLGGKISYHWQRDGLRVLIEAPVDQLDA
jgi:two-component sensor histidine kinase